MKYKYIIIFIVALLVVAAVVFSVMKKSAYAPNDVTTVSTVSYSGNASIDLIQVDSPVPGTRIESPLKVTGKARGPWYFEASFPVFLTDGDGLIIAQGVAQAKGEWMTTEFVPFEAELVFTKPANAAAFGDRASLILKNDNPSGDAVRDMAAEMTLYFK